MKEAPVSNTSLICSAIYFDLLGTVPVWELEDIHISCQNILLIFMRNLFLSVVYIALSNGRVFGFAALCCMSFWLCFLCLSFDVRPLHLINVTYIHIFQWTLARDRHRTTAHTIMCITQVIKQSVILLGDRNMQVWTTCPQLLCSHCATPWPGIELPTSWS